MNRTVEERVKEIEAGKKLRFETFARRPFVVSVIRDKKNHAFGVGVCCVQLPDLWNEEQGIRTSKVRAVKDMLGIPNPHLVNVIKHEASRLQATG